MLNQIITPLSKRSQNQLNTCDPRIIKLFTRVNEVMRCSILEGHRNEKDQNAAFKRGASKLQWPNGNHNKFPSLAVDALPLPIDWKDTRQMVLFAGIVLGIAAEMGLKIRWGGDWNRNVNMNDEKGLVDLPHFEIED